MLDIGVKSPWFQHGIAEGAATPSHTSPALSVRPSIVIAILALWALGPVAAQDHPAPTATVPWPAGLPVYDHVVIVIEENKDFDQIIGSRHAPYFNEVLKAEGACFTQMFGEEHHSQGNYFWLFSGDNQGVAFFDKVPEPGSRPDFPFKTENLGHQLLAKKLSFTGNSEDLPSIGFDGKASKDHHYARKHVPWISFANLPNGTTAADSVNLRFSDFPTSPAGFASLPTVAFVIPNLANDMHDAPLEASIEKGDAWVKNKLDAYYQWAKSHNSLLIITFDESDDKSNIYGPTNPGVPDTEANKDTRNLIPTIFAGAHLKPGDYAEGKGLNHVTILRTLEAMFGLPKSGRQQKTAAEFGISDDQIITDIFAR